MPRKVKLNGNLQLDISEPPKHPAIVRKYELLTPLWGGGEHPNRRDSVTTIRTSSIKGQLRFWWRAVRGWKAEGSIDRLLEIEEKIWGGVTKVKRSSRVTLSVESIEPKNAKYLSAKKVPRYVAFPLLQGSKDDQEQGLSTNIHFLLKIWLNPLKDGDLDIEEEVQAALWAWETFGGIGARTRRGFGALAKVNARNFINAENIQDKLRDLGALDSTAWPKSVPHLTASSPIAVLDKSWKEVIELYMRFRQYRPVAKRLRNGRPIPGPNKWPEPRLLRWAYAPKKYEEPEMLVAPRAQFGLPVPFFFLQDRKLGKDGKMFLTGLQRDQQKIDRLASPLIIRPLDKRTALVAILHSPRVPPGGVHLTPPHKAKKLSKHPVEICLKEEIAEKLVDSGLDVLEIGSQVHHDPVFAFWKCVQDENCTELLNSVTL